MNWTENNIENSIFKAMSILNIQRMPTSKETRITNISGLDGAISDSGGYIYWANKLKLDIKKSVKLLKDDEIKNRIYYIIQQLKINRMPSRSEVLSIEQNQNLHNAIIRGYGYYTWAKMLNLEIKDSETLMGVSYQKICMNQLIQMGYRVEETTMKAPYDLVINGNIKIDVKSGCAYLDECGCRLHTFGINKKLPTCDLYILYALDENGTNIEKVFIIPSKELKLVSMCIGTNSKYNCYINKWEYIDLYNKFYQAI